MRALIFGLHAVDAPPAVFHGERRLALTPMGARILTRLAAMPVIVARSELIGTDGGVAKSETLRVHLSGIRKALPPNLTVEYVPDQEGYRLAPC